MHVLIVEDDPRLGRVLDRLFTTDRHVVELVTSGSDALDVVDAGAGLDVIVLDIGLPDVSGLEVCRRLRDRGSSVPVLMLTARDAVPDRVAGLDAGADDFLAKPFAVAELRARVRALGRRGPIERHATVMLGQASLNLATRTATREGRELPITAREWEVLQLLINRQGRVVSRATILELIWGEITDKANGSLDVIMARIRRKLGPDSIRTIRGEGYAADVE